MHKFVLGLTLSLAAACGTQEGEQNASEMANVADEGGNAAVSEARNEVAADAAAASPAFASFAVGPLKIPYDRALLTPVRTDIQVPPDWKVKVPGTKLIGSDRAALIGKAECLYGESGQASRCNAAQEAGLAFALLEGGLDQFSQKLPATELQKVTLAGVEGVSWQIGAEGEGAEHILLPAGERTILIVRQFRNTGNPSEAALGTVLNDLRLGE
jgi:hypothetical protein